MDRVALGLLDLGVEQGDRVGIWAPNCGEWVLVQYATAKIGAILVNINPAYRTHELRVRAAPVGNRSCSSSAPAFKTSDYAAMIDDGPGDVPAISVGSMLLGHTQLGRLLAPGDRAVPVGDLDRPRRRPWASTTRSTSSTRRAPRASRRAPRSRTTTSSTTATSPASCSATPSTTACASRCPSTTASAWCWATWPRPSHGVVHRHPGAGLRPGGDAAGGRRTSAARRCYGVPTMFIAELAHPGFAEFDLSSLRTGIMAGSPCPVEVMKRVVDRDAHGRGHDHVRHDRDVAGVDQTRRERRPRPAGVGTVGTRACPTSRSRSSTPRPGDVPRRRARRAVHARATR